MSKHFCHLTFYGCGEFARVDRAIPLDPNGNPWADLRDQLARDYDLDPDALDLIEAMWGGPDGEDDGAELVTYDGRLIGCIGRRLTGAEFALLHTIPHFGDVRKTTDAERATPSLSQAAE